MDEKWGWPGAVGAGIVVSIFTLVTISAAGAWPWFSDVNGSTWAAWAQAAGAVAGIGIAIWLAKVQAERNEQNQRLAHAQRYGELYGPAIAIVQETDRRVDRMFDSLSDALQGAGKSSVDFYWGRAHLQEVFLAIPVHQMPTVVSSLSVLRVRELYDDLNDLVKSIGSRYVQGLRISDAEWARIASHRVKWQRELACLRNDLVKLTTYAK